MTKLSILFMVLLIGGCGPGIGLVYVEVDDTFKSYYETFVSEASQEGVNVKYNSIRIRFGTMVSKIPYGQVVGECITGNEVPLVKINKEFWDIAPDYMREELIFHELGHCILGREHVETTRAGGLAKSIMNPILFGSYAWDRPYYIHELFHP